MEGGWDTTDVAGDGAAFVVRTSPLAGAAELESFVEVDEELLQPMIDVSTKERRILFYTKAKSWV